MYSAPSFISVRRSPFTNIEVFLLLLLLLILLLIIIIIMNLQIVMAVQSGIGMSVLTADRDAHSAADAGPAAAAAFLPPASLRSVTEVDDGIIITAISGLVRESRSAPRQKRDELALHST